MTGRDRFPAPRDRVVMTASRYRGRTGVVLAGVLIAAGGRGTRYALRVHLDATRRAPERTITCYPASLDHDPTTPTDTN
jgi:hypothetical protein